MAVPTIDPINAHAAHPGRTLSFFVNAFDPDGDDLTFALINTPPDGATIDDDGRFTWTPTPAQLAGSPYTLTVRANDSDGNFATRNFSITLNNQGPVIDPIGNRTAYLNRPVSFWVNARDPDGDALTFSLASGPPGAVIDPTFGLFTWTPTALGSVTASVLVTDANGASATSPLFTITVTSTPPILDPLPTGLTAHPNVPLSFFAVGIDPDGEPLTYTLTQGPTNSSIDANIGLFTWTPDWSHWTAGDPNIHLIEIRVTDAAGLSQTRQGSITVVNHTPTIVPIPPRTAYAGRPIAFFVNAFDQDRDQLQFSLVNPPAGASIDRNIGFFTWTPPATPLGAVTFTVRVADGGDASVDTSFTLNVIDDAPVLEAPPTRVGHPGRETTFFANAFDRNGDTLSYRVTAGPANAAIDATLGRFTWTPNWPDLGSNSITIETVDPSNLADSKTFTIVVNNQPPTIESIPTRTVAAGDTLQLFINADDPDGDSLSFTLPGVPPVGTSIANILPNSAIFTWVIPANTAPGAYPITVRVGDGGATTDAVFTVIVNAAPVPPLSGTP